MKSGSRPYICHVELEMFSREKNMSPTSLFPPLESPTSAFAPAPIIIRKLRYVDTVSINFFSKEVKYGPTHQNLIISSASKKHIPQINTSLIKFHPLVQEIYSWKTLLKAPMTLQMGSVSSNSIQLLSFL